MSRSEIFIVEGSDRYEGGSALVAFTKQKDAEKFCEQCIDYQSKEPQIPSMTDSPKKWLEYDKKIAAWRTAHPADEYEFYNVIEIELR